MHIEDFKKHFNQQKAFDNKAVYEFYQNINANINKSTVDWRIYQLVQEGVMKRISRGLYKLGKEKNFQPFISNALSSIHERLKTTFPFTDFCIWQTSEINQFIQHISKENFTIIEVEKEVKSSVFSFLKEEQSKPVFMNVDEEIMNLYVRANSHSIILKDIISEAPTQFIEEIETITIEKLLVDIYSDRVIFQSFQGNELKHIFRNAFRQYTINRSKLERYAARRGKKEKLNELIDQNIGK